MASLGLARPRVRLTLARGRRDRDRRVDDQLPRVERPRLLRRVGGGGHAVPFQRPRPDPVRSHGRRAGAADRSRSRRPRSPGRARSDARSPHPVATWSVDGVELAYQWNRDGAPIDGATAATYKLVAADAGADITATVTASKDGYADGTAASAVKAAAKGDSDTSARLDKLLVPSNGTVKATVRVTGQFGIVPVGEVKVFDGTKQIATGTLGADGRVRRSRRRSWTAASTSSRCATREVSSSGGSSSFPSLLGTRRRSLLKGGPRPWGRTFSRGSRPARTRVNQCCRWPRVRSPGPPPRRRRG